MYFTRKRIRFIKLVSFTSKQIQWNRVNMVTNGPNKLAVLTRWPYSILMRVFYKKMYGGFARQPKKVAIIMRWSY